MSWPLYFSEQLLRIFPRSLDALLSLTFTNLPSRFIGVLELHLIGRTIQMHQA
jgi:hypothetical protein